MDEARTLIFIGTGIVALLIGMLLYQLSQRTSDVKFKESRREQVARPREKAASSDAIPAVLRELNRLPVPPEQRHQVARSVSDIVNRTLTERLEVAKKTLDEQYSQVIEEQRRTSAVLQEKYQTVLQEKKQTSSVLESIAEGLVVVNNKGEVVMMNPAAERLLAVNQKERIGKPLTDGLRDEQLVSLAQGSNEEREIVLNAKQEATRRVVRASNAVITDEDGRTVGMVAVLSDVTKQRELEQLKSEFVSKVSHELRTPIVAMQHALSIIADEVAGPLTEEQKKFSALLQRNLQRLNGLINDLLDLSKLEAKKMELRLEPAALQAIVQSVCDTLEAWAQSKGIALHRRVPDGLPLVNCDPARITQVLTNLIGNAVKFTPKQGRVTIEARLLPESQGVELSVADTGVGIAKEDLPKLFSKFQQVGERTASDISGTGLGLAISKEIVELHRGRIWVESDAAARPGTKFLFTLPLDAAHPKPAGA
jgi:two-component system phosphate regulon sensor histidine kinase PhoR